jgi:AcrR family transcriptional regulator
MAEDDVPTELARLWRLPTETRLGRPAELDVDRVVRTAVELADRDGLGGVTLAKVAKELGFTGMSLYRHVGSKDELLTLMGDLATGPVPEIAPGIGPWRAGLRQWALALHAVYARRPWLAELPLSGPPSGPNAIGWMEAALRVLHDTGLDWGAKVGIQSVLAGYVRHTSLGARQLAEGRRGSGLDQAQVERAYGRALAKLVDPERFPHAAQLFASDAFEASPDDDGDVDHDFVFGLELILDGVAATIGTSADAGVPGSPLTSPT